MTAKNFEVNCYKEKIFLTAMSRFLNSNNLWEKKHDIMLLPWDQYNEIDENTLQDTLIFTS